MRLFRWFIVRRLAQQPLRSATTMLGIALGVAVVVAIQLTNASSLAGFETALETVAGQSSLEILGPGVGIDEARLPDLGWLREYGDVAPVIQGDVVWRSTGRPSETLRVLGVDILRDRPFRDYQLLQWEGGNGDPRPQEFLGLLRDSRSAILTARFAGSHGLTVGSTTEVAYGDRTIPLIIRGLLRDEGPARVLDGNFVLMDIAAAQLVLERLGRIDRIEVRLADGVDIAAAEAGVAARLPEGLAVQRPAQRGAQVENMLAAFHLNLTALSYIALLVGLFLVYNTVSVSVLSRRTEIGTLRALGVSRAQVRALFLAEAFALSIVGSAIGLLLGRLLALGTVSLTATTVSVMYIATAAAPPVLAWKHVVLAFASGVPLSLLAALVPAGEAANVPPTAAMRGADRVEARAHAPIRTRWAAAALLALGAWLATLGPVNGLPMFGYASAVAVIFGGSFLVPSILHATTSGVVAFVRRHLKVEDWLAVTNLSAAVPRLSISVAALAVSLSMMVAISIMIGSFRETVVYWVGQTLQADLFVSPGATRRPGIEETLSPEVVQTIASSPDVAAVDRFRLTELPYGQASVRVGGGEFDVLLTHGTLLFKAPEEQEARAAMRRAIGRDEVVASESFTLKHHAAVGDAVELPTPAGPVRFRIAAAYYDYSNDRGVLMMDRATFERHFGARPPAGLTVYLKDGVSAEDARTRLFSTIGDSHHVFINTNQSLRREVLRIFDSTFAITYALEIIAILVAILGVSGTLLTLILEREREMAILRLVGTGRRQIRRMVVAEALVIGAISQGVGLIVGFGLSLLLIYVINVQSFGWTIQFHVPAAFLVQSSIALVLATALAGLYPAHRAAGMTMRHGE